METRTRLPEFLRPLFWDVAFHTLSPERHQSFICLRVIEHGDLDALRWMVGYYGQWEWDGLFLRRYTDPRGRPGR